jgi:hypothetical protein
MLTSFSLSRQMKSNSSVLSTIVWCRVTVQGFVYAFASFTVRSISSWPNFPRRKRSVIRAASVNGFPAMSSFPAHLDPRCRQRWAVRHLAGSGAAQYRSSAAGRMATEAHFIGTNAPTLKPTHHPCQQP